MTPQPNPQVAIIGSGPAGCYLAQALHRALPTAELTIFDRTAAPYGLIRYGVAPDHQHTKAITRQFDRLFQSPDVHFVGGVDVDVDVTLAELRELYDVVVLATGLQRDRALDAPGAQLQGVVAAGEIIRSLNAHPKVDPEGFPRLGSDVVVIGAGNVALDVVRFLVKDRSGFVGSDVDDAALEQYLAAPAQRITVLSRAAAADSKGDPQMLRELAALPRATYTVTDSATTTSAAPQSTDDRTRAARRASVAALDERQRGAFPGPAVSFCFGARPSRILGDEHVSAVEYTLAGQNVTVPASAVITAIGFDPHAAPGAASDTTAAGIIASLPPDLDSGRIAPALYRTGWAQRGSRGAIPENRSSAKLVAEEIVADLADGARITRNRASGGYQALDAGLRERAVDFSQWLALDAHERRTAPEGRVRRKVVSHEQMIDIARRTAPANQP